MELMESHWTGKPCLGDTVYCVCVGNDVGNQCCQNAVSGMRLKFAEHLTVK